MDFQLSIYANNVNNTWAWSYNADSVEAKYVCNVWKFTLLLLIEIISQLMSFIICIFE